MKQTYLLALAVAMAATLAIAFMLIRGNEVAAPTHTDTDIDWTEAADESPIGDDYLDATANVTLSFEHVVPGEYSELYVTVTGRPGSYLEVEAIGPSIVAQAERTSAWVGEEGYVVLTWRITSYGEYEVEVEYENKDLSERILRDTITVE